MTQPQTATHPLHTATASQLPQLHEARNAGMPLDLDWVARVQANTSAIERRAATLPGRRTVKKAHQAAWLARAITLIGPHDAVGRRHRGPGAASLRQGAPAGPRRHPRRRLGLPPLTTGAVCVYHEMVPAAVDALEGSGIPVAAVSTGFPAGLSPPTTCA